MPGSVNHCWTTPSVCTNGDFDPLQRYSCSSISDWWHSVYIEIFGQPFVSLVQQSASPPRTSLHKVSNSLAKCLHPATTKLRLQYWLALKQISCDNILQFVTDVVQRMGVFGKLIQSTVLILSSIPSPCITLSMCYEPLSFSQSSCCFSGYACSGFPDI